MILAYGLKLVLWFVVGLGVYVACAPYTASFRARLLQGCGVAGVLYGLLGTAARGQPAIFILWNFLAAVAVIAVSFAIIEIVQRKFGPASP